MPNFGPDGKRLAFTWSGNGMALMDADGGNREVLSADGWGAQFSPDGKWVAYQTYERTNNGRFANITLIDVVTKEKRVLLEGEPAEKYSQIFWNMEWSPDSRRICFKAGLLSGSSYEVAVTSTEGSSRGFRVLTTETTDNDFGWHPDGTCILLGRHSPQHGGMRLFVCDPETGGSELLESQPLEMPNHSGVWSPDGRQIAFVSHKPPQPTPWLPASGKPEEP